MQIQGLLGHAGAGDNRIYPHSANTVPREKLISSEIYALACGCRQKRLGPLGRTRKHTSMVDRSVYLQVQPKRAARATGASFDLHFMVRLPARWSARRAHQKPVSADPGRDRKKKLAFRSLI